MAVDSGRVLKIAVACMRARIVVVKSDPSLAVGFPDFLEDNWQTNGCVPLRIDCSALF